MPTSVPPPVASPAPDSTAPQTSASKPKQPLSEAAGRALAEAAARRNDGMPAKREDEHAGPTNEVGGRGSLDPTRYGDWEVNGLASDF